MDGDVQYDLATLAFNNGEQLEYFHISILRLQQEIMLSREIFSSTRLLFQYMKVLTKTETILSTEGGIFKTVLLSIHDWSFNDIYHLRSAL